MATGPKDYRDPKVTNTETGAKSTTTNWLWYALGGLVLLLLLLWLFGMFDGNDEVITSTDPVVGTTTAPGTATGPLTTDPVITTDTGTAIGTDTDAEAETLDDAVVDPAVPVE